jgi:hypothetical protein
MKNITWIRPGLWGAVCGAAALGIVGFTWGGWVTSGTAQKAAGIERTSAIVSALTPYCLDRAKNDPASAEIMAQLKAAGNYGRSGVIEKAGWATPLGSTEPNQDLAQACQIALATPS